MISKDIDMKKVFLYAYDKTNLGDDLFIETIVNRYPKVKFYMISDIKNKKQFAKLQNLCIIDRDSKIVKLLHRIRPSLVARYEAFYKNRADAHVYIGGSIFMEYPTWKNIVNWWNYQADNYKFYVLGANFGPYEIEEYKDEMKHVFSKLKDVCFRDQYSYKLFQDVDTVRYAPDILFGYDKIPTATQVKKQVFVSLIDCSEKNDKKLRENHEQYIEKMADLLKQYRADDYHITFASFCTEEGDMRAIPQVCDKLPDWKMDKDYSVLEYNGYNAQDILKEMVESELILASRFHAVILGFLTGRAVLPILYSDKTKHVLEDLDYKGKYIDIRDMKQFESPFKINDSMGKIDNVMQLSKEAEKHFESLDSDLNR